MEQKLNYIIQLFEERDDVCGELSEIIVSELDATLFTAIRSLLQSSTQDTECVSIEVEEDELIVACAVTYEDPSYEPDFIKQSESFPINGKEYRNVRIALPLDIICKPATEILSYLKSSQVYVVDAEHNIVESDVSIKEHNPEFDESTLTAEQKLQSMYFEDSQGGMKH